MSRFLKGSLRALSSIILFGGPILAVVLVVAAAVTRTIGFAGPALGLYLLFWSILIGGVLRLLLSIDDRLERLEGKQ